METLFDLASVCKVLTVELRGAKLMTERRLYVDAKFFSITTKSSIYCILA